VTWAARNASGSSPTPPGLRGERKRVLPHEPVDHDRRDAGRQRGRAFDYYLRINHSARWRVTDLHRCEPYVYAQMIAGKDASTHGGAQISRLMGTAAWNLVVFTQHIPGIRPQHDGLCVDPPGPAARPLSTVTVEAVLDD
jgi:cellobiose phosphorylase